MGLEVEMLEMWMWRSFEALKLCLGFAWVRGLGPGFRSFVKREEKKGVAWGPTIIYCIWTPAAPRKGLEQDATS